MTEKDFQRYLWMTPNQRRDDLLAGPGLDTEMVDRLRKLALEETERRKSLPAQFIRCVRCYGYHDQMDNIDGLCERCESATAPARYDQTHGITSRL